MERPNPRGCEEGIAAAEVKLLVLVGESEEVDVELEVVAVKETED